MDQRIRFCDAGAGRIAYATVGEGHPLVLPSWWVGHLELTWENERFRRFVEALAARHTVVRYDPLGSGLSERKRRPADFSLQAEREALGGLLEHLGLERYSLFGFSSGGPLAVATAVARPERLSRLVLYGTYADGSRITDPETRKALVQMVREHWGLGSRVLASVFLPEGEPEEARWFARLQRASTDSETAAQLLSLAYALDVRPLLPELAAPALVLHRRGDPTIPYELGVEVAATIPGARFRTLEGDRHFPWLGDTQELLEELAGFMRLGAYPLPGGAEAAAPVEGRVLSDREVEVLALVAEGLSDREIAERLVLSAHTVHRHVANVRAKLGKTSRAAAVAEGQRLGLI